MARSAAYGKEHKRLRARWVQLIARGGVRCWRCGRAILPGMLFDLGHDDRDPTKRTYMGPEHRYCSRSAGALKKQGRIKIINTMIDKTCTDRW